jgi:hypothetical protein
MADRRREPEPRSRPSAELPAPESPKVAEIQQQIDALK